MIKYSIEKLKRDKGRSKSHLYWFIFGRLSVKQERFCSRRQYAKYFDEKPYFFGKYNYSNLKARVSHIFRAD